MDSPKDTDLELEPETKITKKMKTDQSQSDDTNDEDYLQMTPGDKLCEDELSLIFSNSWISTSDLLSFRLVSKSWRDAATTTLLKRDACRVDLYGDSNQNPPCFYKNNGKNTVANKLSQLTDLISNSAKFPASDFHIQTSLDAFTPYTNFPDLLEFFKLHGDKVKTLRPHGWMTHKCLLDIFFMYAPTLEGLDLRGTSIKLISEENQNFGEGISTLLRWNSKALPIKSLTIKDSGVGVYCQHPDRIEDNDPDRDTDENVNFPHDCNSADRQLLHLLLSSPSKLSRIENVSLKWLRTILKEGKGQLIRSFKYELEDALTSAPLIKEFISLNPKPKLSTVILDLDCIDSPPATCLPSVNEFFDFCKDTVQNLTLFFPYNQLDWDPLLSIPPMKKLKSFTLMIKTWWEFMCEDHRLSECEVCQEECNSVINFRGTVFQFENGISAHNYFPSLREVSLNSTHAGFTEASLMSFFAFKSGTDEANWDSLPQVNILRVNSIDIGTRQLATEPGTSQSPTKVETETPLISVTFPNIRILKIRCGDVSSLSNGLWALCPNVEFMEIYSIASCSSCGIELEMSHLVDKFFTGFSSGLLRNLRKLALLAAGGLSIEKLENSEEGKFVAKRSSITDLTHLRELKLRFGRNWSTEFATFVTRVYAFSKMPNTKFIVSYDPQVSAFSFNKDEAAEKDNDDDGGDSAESYEGNDDVEFSDDKSEGDKNEGDENEGDENEGDKIEGDENEGDENDHDVNEDGDKIAENIDEGSDSDEISDAKIAKYEELCFGSLEPYVHIVHEKQNYELWD